LPSDRLFEVGSDKDLEARVLPEPVHDARRLRRRDAQAIEICIENIGHGKHSAGHSTDARIDAAHRVTTAFSMRLEGNGVDRTE
jgi:hypothetical protein